MRTDDLPVPESWDTSLPDWKTRIVNRKPLIPDLPLFDAVADKALAIFKRLRLPDVIGNLRTNGVYIARQTAPANILVHFVQSQLDQIPDGVLLNDSTLDTDSGFIVTDTDGGVLFDAGVETWIAGRERTLQSDLAKLDWGSGVVAGAKAEPLDLEAMYDLTPAAERAVRVGQMMRGGNGAPMPAGLLPTNIEIGKNWVNGARVNLMPGHPQINIDPFWRTNETEDSFVHPVVMHFPHRFMGFEYMMVVNPYPNGTEPLENPVLYGSHNMQDWELFTHIPQPMAWPEEYEAYFVNSYLSDPFITWHPHSRELIVGWRRHFRNGTDPDGNTHHIEARSTFDGINWSPRRIIDRSNWGSEEGSNLICPLYFYNPANRLWYCYVGRGGGNWEVKTKRDIFDPIEPWSAVVDTGISGWHGDAKVIGNRVWLWSNVRAFGTESEMYWSDPDDWANFTRIDSFPGLVDASAWVASRPDGSSTGSYKGAFVPHIYDDGTISLKLLYQCRPSQYECWLFHLETPRLPYTDA